MRFVRFLWWKIWALVFLFHGYIWAFGIKWQTQWWRKLLFGALYVICPTWKKWSFLKHRFGSGFFFHFDSIFLIILQVEFCFSFKLAYYFLSWIRAICLFICPFWAKLVSQMSHWNALFPSWTDALCVFKLNLCAKLLSQILHLNNFFPSWTYDMCLFNVLPRE